jgi:hypothetical protein
VSDEIEIVLPDGAGMIREHGVPNKLALPADSYADFVREVSRAGRYGDPVHWSVYNRMHSERNRLRQELDIVTRHRDALLKLEELKPPKLVVTIAGQEIGEPVRHWATEAELLADADRENVELKAVIVSQAREIARLKGESA